MDKIPISFICPITRKIMNNPYIDEYGNNYDISSIDINTISPITKKKINKLLINRLLKNVIDDYIRYNNIIELEITGNLNILWQNSLLAKNKTYNSINIYLSDIDKHNINEIFNNIIIFDDIKWYPRFDNKKELINALTIVDSKYRLKIYGEFAQYISYTKEYNRLGILDYDIKNYAIKYFLKSIYIEKNIMEIDMISYAINDFSEIYNNPPDYEKYKNKILKERKLRWLN
jgi:hypothetical protein